jgi:3-oxoacyl-[acyl-carrier protein] reductase
MSNMVQINYLAPIQIVQSLLGNLKRGKAHIVNIGSMGGFSGSSKFPGLSIYSSTKAALANLSECWAEELKEFGVTSNCLALGAVNTEMLKNAFPGYEAPVNSRLMGEKIVDFSINFNGVLNGKIIPFSVSTP